MDLLRRAPVTLSLAVLALLALLAALKLAQSVAAPVTLGFVVGVVFAPMATRMGRIGAPPAVSATVALALAGLVLTVLISAAGPVVTELLEQVPKIEAELRRWMEEVARVVRGVDTIGREIEETLAEGGEEAVKAAVDENTRAVFCESISNPGGYVTDLPAVAAIADNAGVPLIVDNTSATPYLCNPIAHGATLVVHSTTKYLTGNGTVTGGCVVDSGKFDWSANDKFPSLSQPEPAYHGLKFHETFGPLAFTFHGIAIGLRDLGMTMNPQAAHYTLMGIETLSLRMARHVENAGKVAAWLENHPAVESVTYAGLPSSPYADRVAALYPRGAGGLFTFALKAGYEACVKFVDSVELFSHVANLGDTRSLVIHSASTTHRQLTPEQQAAAGAAPNMVRVSIGIEDANDLIRDLDQAIARATA